MLTPREFTYLGRRVDPLLVGRFLSLYDFADRTPDQSSATGDEDNLFLTHRARLTSLRGAEEWRFRPRRVELLVWKVLT